MSKPMAQFVSISLLVVLYLAVVCLAAPSIPNDLPVPISASNLTTSGRMQARNSVPHRVHLWENGLVPFRIDTSIKNRRQIYDAINHYHHMTRCIRFVTNNKGRYKDYILFRMADKSRNESGCFSDEIGFKGGIQEIVLDTGCYHKGTIVHEIGHALGFYHEHQRSDRDNHVRVNVANIKNENETLAQFEKNVKDKECRLTEYDLHSIMQYEKDAFSKNGENTIEDPRQGTNIKGPNDKYGLSRLDIMAVNILYCMPWDPKDFCK